MVHDQKKAKQGRKNREISVKKSMRFEKQLFGPPAIPSAGVPVDSEKAADQRS